jgi:hypothetical protein
MYLWVYFLKFSVTSSSAIFVFDIKHNTTQLFSKIKVSVGQYISHVTCIRFDEYIDVRHDAASS